MPFLLALLQVGKALDLMASATPMLGGVAGLAAAALKVGDHHV